MFTLFDPHCAHLENGKKPSTHHKWFLINCARLMSYKGHGFRKQIDVLNLTLTFS